MHRKIFEEENYDNIWKNLTEFGINNPQKASVFIDEFQNLPEASKSVKYLFDHYHTKFFLTGSSSFYLKNLFPESMANRKIIIELFPLNFSEFLTFKGVTRNIKTGWKEKAKEKNYISYQKLISFYKEYMQFGGFPEVVLEANRERKRELFEEIFTSYFEKDVKTLTDYKDLAKIRDLILLLAQRVGAKLEVAKISSELFLSRETVYNYLEFLQKSYFLYLIPKHTKSIDRAVAGGKKVYLCDCGLSNYLSQINTVQLFEASVFQNISQEAKKIAYFDEEGRLEIDFVVDGRVGLEVKKAASSIKTGIFKQRLNKAKLKEGYMVSLEFDKGKEIILATDL